MKGLLSRRTRIVAVILLPVLAALMLGWLESRTWIVIQNASDETLGVVRVSTAHESWESVGLAADESRRWQVARRDVAEVVIEVSGAEAAIVAEFHPEAGSVTFVRIERDRSALLRTQRGFWARWLSW